MGSAMSLFELPAAFPMQCCFPAVQAFPRPSWPWRQPSRPCQTQGQGQAEYPTPDRSPRPLTQTAPRPATAAAVPLALRRAGASACNACPRQCPCERRRRPMGAAAPRIDTCCPWPLALVVWLKGNCH